MARPKHEHPTPAELEVLQILWERGPCTVRQVLGVLNRRRRRAYTSVMSLLNVMVEKGLLARKPLGRAFIYQARAQRRPTLTGMAADLVGRAFAGSASALVAALLQPDRVNDQELEAMRRAIDAYEKERGD